MMAALDILLTRNENHIAFNSPWECFKSKNKMDGGSLKCCIRLGSYYYCIYRIHGTSACTACNDYTFLKF